MGQSPSVAEDSCGGDVCGCFPFSFSKDRRRRGNEVFEEISSPEGHASASELERAASDAGGSPEDEGDLVLTDVEDDDDEQQTEREKSGRATPPPPDIISKLAAVDCGLVITPRKSDRSSKRRKRKKSKQQKRVIAHGEIMDSERLALRRVCVVDGQGRPLLNATVRVPRPTDDHDRRGYYYSSMVGYLSRLLPRVNRCGDNLDAGITPEEARERAAILLRDKIVVGHSVSMDLMALGMEDHPPDMVRDTAAYPPFTRANGTSKKLRALTKSKLGREIQQEGEFHCCVEDAVAALDLYKLVWQEWEESIRAQNEISRRGDSKDTSGRPFTENKHREQPVATPKTKQRKKKKKKKKASRFDKASLVKQPAKNPTQTKGHMPSLTVVFFPILLPMRTLHDLSLLSKNAVVCLCRKIRGRLMNAPSFSSGTRMSLSRKRRKWKARRFLLFESTILFLHCLSEVWFSLSAASNNEWDVASMLCANGAIAVGLIGMNLFFSQSRNGKESQILFGILAQYHIIAICIKLSTGFGVTPSVWFQMLAPLRELGRSRIISTTLPLAFDKLSHQGSIVASALAHLVYTHDPGTPLAVVIISEVVEQAKYNLALFPGALAPFIKRKAEISFAWCARTVGELSGFLPLACHAFFFLWFALRSVKRI